jgi:predicted HicB family RNase H-like nuclease
MMNYKGYVGVVEFDAEDRMFYGKVIGLNDVIGFEGSSVEGLETSFHRAVDAYLDVCEEMGRAPEKTYSGTIYVRTDPEVHKRVDRAATMSNTSINQWVKLALLSYLEKEQKASQSR